MIEEKSFRIYLADSYYLQANDQMFSQRYSDIVGNMYSSDSRTGDEIAEEIITKLELSLKEGG